MAERLIIRNFAGIDEIDIELGRINIFIGAQASGKSICVKCLYYFKGCVNSLLRQAMQPQLPVEDLETLFAAGFSYMFEPTAFTAHTVLRYSDGNNFIQVKNIGKQLKVTFSDFYANLFERARKAALSRSVYSPEEAAFGDTALYRRFKQTAAQELGLFGASTLLFLPASRATYSLTSEPQKGSYFTDSHAISDPFLNQFRQLYTSLKRSELLTRHELQGSLIDVLSAEVLRAEFKQENDEDFLVQLHGTKTSLAVASSGQQEVLPVVLMLRYLALAAWLEPQVVLIEEPEAHLHPSAQNSLTQLMAAVYNARKAPLQLFLTTHTPYLLSSFNNLIYAGQLASKLKKNDSAGRKKLYAAVPKKMHMKLEDFRVYGLENGKATLLIDEEFGLLMAHSLDSVSDVIADQYGALMDLDASLRPTTAKQ